MLERVEPNPRAARGELGRELRACLVFMQTEAFATVTTRAHLQSAELVLAACTIHA